MPVSIRSLRLPRMVALVILVVILAAIPLLLRNLFPFVLALVSLAAWFGGRKWALGVTACILALSLLQLRSPSVGSDPAEKARVVNNLINFSVISLLIIVLTEALNTTRQRSDADAETLRRQKESYRLLFDANPHPMWVYDVETLRFLAINDVAVRRYGYSRDEFLAMTIADIRPYEDLDALKEQISRSSGETFLNSTGWRHVLKDGSIIDVEISSHPLEMDGRQARLVMAVDVTERKRAEDALLRSESRSRRLVESNLIGVAFVDANGLVVDANDEFLKISGFSREELSARAVRWDRLVQEYQLTAYNAIPLPANRAWQATRFEAECMRTDGTRVPALFGVVRLEEGSDETLCFALDLTGLRRAEKERDRLLAAEQVARASAELSERRYRLLAAALPQIVWTAGPDGGADYFNPRWSQYSGLDKPGSIGMGWQSAIHPRDLEKYRTAWENALESKESFNLNLRLRRADGIYRWHLLQQLCSGERADKEVRWLGTFTDIHDQKWAEGALAFLAKATALLSSSLDLEKTLESVARLAVPHIADLCQIDLVEANDGVLRRVVAASVERDAKGTVRLSGRSPSEPVESHPAVAAYRSGRSQCETQPTHGDEAEPSADSKAFAAFGEPGVGSYICVPLESRGRVLGVISFAMAASGRRYGPADPKLAEQLARRAALAVDNARLYHAAEQARREAEVANLAKDRFLAVLSHELRTPLNPVLLAASAMVDDPSLPAGLRPMLELTRRNVQLEARLIGDLLDVSRIAAGKMRFAKEVVDAHDIIREALEICKEDIREAGLAMHVELAAEERHLFADPTRLQQVVWNLAKNAAKFTPSGGQLIVRSRNVRHEPRDSAAARLILEVQDSGIGIDPPMLSKIFQAFEQGDARENGRAGGLGLGLAISRAVVEAHGGRLSAESAGKGQGSTFLLDLPTTPAPVTRAWQAPDPESVSAQPLSILLVEDNRDTLRTLAWALERRGHVVVATDCMAAALDAASAGRFDLVISDIELPDGNGLELMGRIGRAGATPGIAMSGYASEEDVQQSLAAGFTEHLTKPVSFHDLERAIRNATAGSSAVATAHDSIVDDREARPPALRR
jgi:PAS domain S-box-containing protein